MQTLEGQGGQGVHAKACRCHGEQQQLRGFSNCIVSKSETTLPSPHQTRRVTLLSGLGLLNLLMCMGSSHANGPRSLYPFRFPWTGGLPNKPNHIALGWVQWDWVNNKTPALMLYFLGTQE